MNSNIFYNYDKVLSYNSFLNFLIGERGVGKTYGMTKFLIKYFLKTGREFVYLRRYKTELKESVPQFFDKIKEDPDFKDVKFEVKNGKFYINKMIAGYSMPLSTAFILKGSTYANVYTIMFDEFIIDKGCYHYLPNEVINLLDICETIGRMRDIRVFLLGNAISSTNPYFNFFDLTIPKDKDIKTYKDGLILVNYIKNDKYRQVKKQTRFGRLIAGTIYEKYAIDNEFLRDNKAGLAKKSKEARYYCTIYFNNLNFAIWVDYKEGNMYINNKIDITCPKKFVFNTDDMNDNTIYLRGKTSPFTKNIIDRYTFNKLYFDTQAIKNNFMPLMKKWLNF